MSAKIEKNIITGMILSGRFLEEIKPIYRPLTVPFARTVADWCIEYYEEYKKPWY